VILAQYQHSASLRIRLDRVDASYDVTVEVSTAATVPSVSIQSQDVFCKFAEPALYPSAVDSEIAFAEL
jgi:hypothetical protein